jgi:hypothetical protein
VYPVDQWWVWIVPALVFVAVFVLGSFRLLAAQTQQIRRLMILAFGLFVFGAIVMETVGGVVFGVDNLLEAEVTAAIEEFFEMSGVVAYIYAMLVLLWLLNAGVLFGDPRPRK